MFPRPRRARLRAQGRGPPACPQAVRSLRDPAVPTGRRERRSRPPQASCWRLPPRRPTSPCRRRTWRSPIPGRRPGPSRHVRPGRRTERGRRVLLGDVDAGTRVRGARSAGDEDDARTSGQLAVRLCHHGGGAFLPGHHRLDGRVPQGIEHIEIALPGNTEDAVDTLVLKGLDQHSGGGSWHGPATAHPPLWYRHRRARIQFVAGLVAILVVPILLCVTDSSATLTLATMWR